MRFNMASALLMAMIAISMVFVVDGQLRHQTSVPSTKKIVCLYNSTSFSREGKISWDYFFLFCACKKINAEASQQINIVTQRTHQT